MTLLFTDFSASKKYEETTTEEPKFKVLGSTKDLMAGIRGIRESKSGYHSDGAESYKGGTVRNLSRKVTSAGKPIELHLCDAQTSTDSL